MHKKAVSLFFLVIFTMFVSAPTVISLMKKSCDTSVLFSMNEEENKSMNETLKIFEVKFSDSDKYQFSFIEIEKEKSYNSYLKNYVPFVVECFSPPPELS